VFNVLGPICNPAGAERQLVGVYDAAWVPRLAEVLQRLGAEAAWVVHSEDGLDELSVFAPTRVARLEGGRIVEETVDPKALGVGHPATERAHVQGGEAARNLELLTGAIAGTAGAATDIVILNAGAALTVGGLAPDLAAGVALARATIAEGKARAKLDQFAQAARRRS
jgi:anthranilate phosphoribosyltransferase